MKKSSSQGLLLGFICLAAFLLRLIYLWEVKSDVLIQNLLIDSEFYDQWAKRILAGDWIGEGVYQQDPLYAYLVAFLYKLFGASPFAVRIAQAVADSLTCVFLYAAARLLWGSICGLLSAFLYAFYGVAIAFSGLLDKTSFSTLLIAASLFMLIKARTSQKVSIYLTSGIFFGLAALIRGNVLVAFLFICAGLFFERLWKKELSGKEIKNLSALIVGLALVVSLTALRNYWAAKDTVLITANSGISMYLGNRPESYGTFAAPSFVCTTPDCEAESTKMIAEKGLGRSPLKASEVSNYWFKLGLDEISRQPSKWIRLLGQKLYWALNNFELIETYSHYYFQERSKVLRLSLISYGVLFALGMMGLVLALRQSTQSLPVFLFFLGYLTSLLIFFVTSRHRFPLTVPLLLAAPVTLHTLWQAFGNHQWKRVVPMGIALAVFTGISYAKSDFSNIVASNTMATPYVHAAFIYRDRGDVSVAIEQIHKAISLRPNSAWQWLALGELELGRQNQAQAEEAIKKGLQIDPNQPEGWNYLGKIYFQKKDHRQAAGFFKKAIETSTIPEDTQVYIQNYQNSLNLPAR